jgi:hypothetical protein
VQDIVEPPLNPGDFKDLDYSKAMNVDDVEGLSVLLTSVLGGGEAGSLLLQHKYVKTCTPRVVVMNHW